ncbi:MAG: energy-coupling factor transporter ATPase [Oscillospiraceae bacterium]|jgi:energy-coupling factor transport system ATP-binding protein|nr:energy-coupling factor transporter ATPase [Oscillospiraceae bacterium]
MIVYENVTHIYNRGLPNQQIALDDVNLRFEDGEFVGIIGRTGSGKSTLVQHMNGLLKPTTGRILMDGKDVSIKGLGINFNVGIVLQNPEDQIFEQTVFKEIAFGPQNMKLDSGEIKRRVAMAMDFVGLPKDILETSPFDLSGGQKRRIAIASVIAMQPRVLVLDEPTSGLDSAGKKNILQRIYEHHKKEKTTVVLVSHNMEEVAQYVERVVVLEKAKVTMEGKVDEIFEKPNELRKIGLDIPRISVAFLKLKELGYDVKNVHTLKQAKTEFFRLKKTLQER